MDNKWDKQAFDWCDAWGRINIKDRRNKNYKHLTLKDLITQRVKERIELEGKDATKF